LKLNFFEIAVKVHFFWRNLREESGKSNAEKVFSPEVIARWIGTLENQPPNGRPSAFLAFGQEMLSYRPRCVPPRSCFIGKKH
jgi:hypothetical protein